MQLSRSIDAQRRGMEAVQLSTLLLSGMHSNVVFTRDTMYKHSLKGKNSSPAQNSCRRSRNIQKWVSRKDCKKK